MWYLELDIDQKLVVLIPYEKNEYKKDILIFLKS